jgi:hypothetical protein
MPKGAAGAAGLGKPNAAGAPNIGADAPPNAFAALFPKRPAPGVVKLKGPEVAGVDAAAGAIEVGVPNGLEGVVAAVPPKRLEAVAPKGLLV